MVATTAPAEMIDRDERKIGLRTTPWYRLHINKKVF
jgi:hypothetical protein